VQHLIVGIRVAGLRRWIVVEVYSGVYGQLRQELADPVSGLHQFQP
jgi:hypothetical protein